MAAIVRRLGDARNPARDQYHTIYTVPAGKKAILRSMFQGVDLGASPMGMLVAGAGFIWLPQVQNFGSRIYPLSTVLHAGQTVQVYHGGGPGGAYSMLQGVELDARDSETLWNLMFNTLTPNVAQSYTVPAGKRVRVREVVICNHGDTVNFSVYINAVGHFVKTTTQPSTPHIFAMDMVANAGEQIMAFHNGPNNHHVYFSGTITDA